MSLLCVMVFVVGWAAFLVSVRVLRPEQVFILNPSIDTTFAAGYSEARFATIRKGMSSADVQAVLGEPLYKQMGANNTEEWHYSDDGACRWWDFAWYVREVHFGYSGNVSYVVRDVRYD